MEKDSGFLTKIERIFVNPVERVDVPLWKWGLFAISVLFARCFLESILERAHFIGFDPVPIFAFETIFFHFLFYYLSFFLVGVLLLSVLSKEGVKNVSKVVITYSPIIMIVPIIDGLILRRGYSLGYPEFTFQFSKLISYLFNPLAPYPGFTTTPGMRFEIWIGAILIAFYIYLKRRSLLWTILGIPITGLCIFITGMAPIGMAHLLTWIGSVETQLPPSLYVFKTGGLISADQRRYGLIFVLLFTILLFIFLYREKKEWLKSYKGGVFKGLGYAGLGLFGLILGLLLVSPGYKFLFKNPIEYLIIPATVLSLFFIISGEGALSPLGWILPLLGLSYSFSLGYPTFLIGVLLLVTVIGLKKIRMGWLFRSLYNGLLGFLSVVFGLSLVGAGRIFYILPPLLGLLTFLIIFLISLTRRFTGKVPLWWVPLALGIVALIFHNSLFKEMEKDIKPIAHYYNGEYLYFTPFYKGAYRDAAWEHIWAYRGGIKEPWIHYQIGNADLKAGMNVAASAAFWTACPDTLYLSDLPRVILALGYTYLKLGEKPEGETTYTRAIELNYYPGESWYQLGVYYKIENRFDEAYKAFRNAYRLGEYRGEALSHLGDIKTFKGDIEGAEGIYKRAIEEEPRNLTGYFKLGALYFHKGLLDKALEIYREAEKIEPTNPVAKNNLGMVWAQKGNLPKAALYFLRTISLNPKFLDAYSNLAHTFEALGRIDKALFVWKKALEVNPNYEEAKEAIKRLSKKEGK